MIGCSHNSSISKPPIALDYDGINFFKAYTPISDIGVIESIEYVGTPTKIFLQIKMEKGSIPVIQPYNGEAFSVGAKVQVIKHLGRWMVLTLSPR